jgi:hypothetical protein
MRVNINSNGLYSITSIDAEMLNTVMFILGHAKDRCFKEFDEGMKKYVSGDGFSMALGPDELRKFHDFVKHFWIEYENMKSRMNLKK